MSSNIPEPCDRCPSKDMVWCQSNGCSTEEDIKYIEEEFFVNDGWLKSVKLPYRVNEDGSKTWIKTGDLEEEEEKIEDINVKVGLEMIAKSYYKEWVEQKKALEKEKEGV